MRQDLVRIKGQGWTRLPLCKNCGKPCWNKPVYSKYCKECAKARLARWMEVNKPKQAIKRRMRNFIRKTELEMMGFG